MGKKKGKKIGKADRQWARDCASDALATLTEGFIALCEGREVYALECFDEASSMLFDARGTLRVGRTMHERDNHHDAS